MDKRRYVSRSPRNPKTIHSMEDDCCGKPAMDGFTVRHREGLKPPRDRYYERPHLPKGLMDESEASWGGRGLSISIYNED
jgi:hypothetical protein